MSAVTVAIPSLNQGEFIGAALRSIFAQPVQATVNLMDAGSTDGTLAAVAPWRRRLAAFRSAPDGGQAIAVNEGLGGAKTPWVAWLNADDVYLPDGLARLAEALERSSAAPFAYGQADLVDRAGRKTGEYRVSPWSRDAFARRCFIAQPATLIRREAWEAVGGLDTRLHMALDYDLWWRLAALGTPVFVDARIAATRVHGTTKTMSRPVDHYREAMAVVRRHHGHTPLWWWLKMPLSIGARAVLGRQVGYRRSHGDG